MSGSRNTKIITYTQAKHFEKIPCQKCGVSFKLGDLLHITQAKSKSRYYHEKCWNSMLY